MNAKNISNNTNDTKYMCICRIFFTRELETRNLLDNGLRIDGNRYVLGGGVNFRT